MSNANHANSHDEGHIHVVPVSRYVAVAIALFVLLALTYGMAHVDLGASWNLAVALTIAVVKMLLVVLIFMEMKWSTRVNWVVAGSCLLWLCFLLSMTLVDEFTRHGTLVAAFPIHH